jgi:hypothetical protein
VVTSLSFRCGRIAMAVKIDATATIEMVGICGKAERCRSPERPPGPDKMSINRRLVPLR